MSMLGLLAVWSMHAAAADLHVVHAGETLEGIAAQTGLAVDAIRAANELGVGATLAPGEVLRLPGGETPSGSMVLSLSGTGQATFPKGDTAPLALGQALPVGSIICTDPDSYTTLRLAAVDATHAHDEVTLLAGTCVTVDASGVRAGRRSSVLSVRQGSVAVRDSAGAPGSVSVRVGEAVTAGEQGGFRLTVEEGGAARTEAVTRPVAVMGARTQLDLGAGYGSRVELGKPPSPAVRLLLGGALLRPGPG